jgi:RNA polymerase sigma-70 factor, ECF subfamily
VESNSVAVFVARLHSGDERFFADLVLEHSVQVRRHCRHFAIDSDDEQDLVQATWVLVWENRRTYSGRGSFAGWLRRLARTVCTRAARRRPVTICVDDVEVLFEPVREDAQHALERQNLEDDQLDLVMSLPKRRRAVVLARLCAGLSTEETAVMLQCRPGTVKATLHKAIKSLAAAVETPADVRPADL